LSLFEWQILSPNDTSLDGMFQAQAGHTSGTGGMAIVTYMIASALIMTDFFPPAFWQRRLIITKHLIEDFTDPACLLILLIEIFWEKILFLIFCLS
jgi:hypothetical protein